MAVKTYLGKTIDGQKSLTVHTHGPKGSARHQLKPLYPRNSKRNLSFEWGTEASNEATVHLAEAILADHLGNKSAKQVAQEFADEFLCKPGDLKIREEEIAKWLRTRYAMKPSIEDSNFDLGEATSSGEMHLRDSPLVADRLTKLRMRIDPDELEKHGFPRPKDVRLSRSTDSTGEDAFYVYLVFPDRTPEEALAWDRIEPMVSWVRNLVWTESGEQLWPYVKVKRQKELAGGPA